VVDARDAPVGNDGGGVVNVGVGIDEANDGGDALQGVGDVLQGSKVVGDEAAAQQQVLGRVARKGQLRERNDVGAEVAGTVSVIDDLAGVALEVADDGIYLRKRDP
jgi:hypothetical protein